MTAYLTTEKVTCAWLATLPGITAAMVDPVLPTPADSWATTGFITPYALGGLRGMYVPVAHPVVGLKCWAWDPDTGRPPWNQAANLAETIAAGCFATSHSVFLTVPYCDQQARILSVYLLEEPRRAYGDMGDYACFDTSVAIHWAAR